MSSIEQNLAFILSSRYGEDVRQAIHDAIHDCYEDGKAGSVDLVAREQIANLVANAGSSDKDSELVDIRTGQNAILYKSAGDAVRNQVLGLKERNIFESYNLINEYAPIYYLNGYFLGGTIEDIEDPRIYVIYGPFYNIDKNQKYYFWSNFNFGINSHIYFLKKDGSIVSSGINNTKVGEFTIPDDVIAFFFQDTVYDVTLSKNNCLSKFPYKYTGRNNYLLKGDLVDGLLTFETENLIDEDSPLMHNNAFYEPDGLLNTGINGHTVYAPIVNFKYGVKYYYKFGTNYGTGTHILFLKKDGTINGAEFVGSIEGSFVVNDRDVIAIIAQDSIYRKGQNYISEKNEYSEHKFKPVIPSNYDVSFNETSAEILLKGKKLGIDGDSIAQGAGFSGGYGGIIANTYSMNIQNIAVGGGTITANTYYDGDGEGARHWICRSVANLDDDCDYILINGGVNDASRGDTFGTITEGYDDTLDDTTFCGAMESLCKTLITKFAGKKYGYIAVHKMASKYSSIYKGANNYYSAAKKICEKWGVPFLDLNVTVPPFGLLPTTSEIRQTYTKDNDGWHPNEEGYKKYYNDKIVNFMLSL